MNTIWLSKNKDTVWIDYYGWSVDGVSAAIIIADDPTEAVEVLVAAENSDADDNNILDVNYIEALKDGFDNNQWTWEKIGQTRRKKQVLLFA